MYKNWGKSFRKCWVYQKRKFVSWYIRWLLRARKFKSCWKHWMDKRSCHLVRRHESACWGLFDPNRTAHKHNRLFARNESDRTVLVSLQKSTAKWWTGTSSMSRGHHFALGRGFSHHWLLSLRLDVPLNKFCTHYTVRPRKSTFNRDLHLLKPALSTFAYLQ